MRFEPWPAIRRRPRRPGIYVRAICIRRSLIRCEALDRAECGFLRRHIVANSRICDVPTSVLNSELGLMAARRPPFAAETRVTKCSQGLLIRHRRPTGDYRDARICTVVNPPLVVPAHQMGRERVLVGKPWLVS